MMDESKSQYLPYQKDDIICNNFNLNANGFNVNTIPEPLSGLLTLKGKIEIQILELVHLAPMKRDLVLITRKIFHSFV